MFYHIGNIGKRFYLMGKYTFDIFFRIDDTLRVNIYFQNRNLEKLYTIGRSKKYPLPQQIIDSFFEVLAILEAAKDINDFRKQSSLNFEKMTNTEKSYSFRLNRKYRLEVIIDWENEEETIGIIGIAEISKHYQ